jgi:hypothetical protein
LPNVVPQLRSMTASPLVIRVAAQMVNAAIRFATADLPHAATPRGMQVAFKTAWICAETLFTVAPVQAAVLTMIALEVRLQLPHSQARSPLTTPPLLKTVQMTSQDCAHHK